MPVRKRLAAALVAAVAGMNLCAACAGSTSNDDGSGPADGASVTDVADASMDDANTVVTFAAVYAEVFAAPAPEGDGPTCGASCHLSTMPGTAPAGLDLSSEQRAYEGLMGSGDGGVTAATSGFCTPPDVRFRVAPGDYTHSMLFRRINGNTCAERMPVGHMPLRADQIGLVQRWITGGALR